MAAVFGQYGRGTVVGELDGLQFLPVHDQVVGGVRVGSELLRDIGDEGLDVWIELGSRLSALSEQNPNPAVQVTDSEHVLFEVREPCLRKLCRLLEGIVEVHEVTPSKSSFSKLSRH